MNTKNCLCVEKGSLRDYERVVHRLRIAAAAGDQCEERRQRIRAATQC